MPACHYKLRGSIKVCNGGSANKADELKVELETQGLWALTVEFMLALTFPLLCNFVSTFRSFMNLSPH